jgi:hypothetical protein
MDTIILQKIIIRNYKQSGWHYYRNNSIENWPYALPKDILRQLKHYDSNSKEIKELLEILKEQINLVNSPTIGWEEYENYTETETRRSMGAEYNIPDQLIQQLKEVRAELLENERYSDYIKELPEIKNRE